jgi:hypothetical protein
MGLDLWFVVDNVGREAGLTTSHEDKCTGVD